ncbi:AMP-binding protein [Nocardioides sp. zg-1228]|uniref:AMP-binding protein n=1 Tax=Nocardioides sp. zg-1228 TaxID=2763008 RepID=UPI00164314AE|nr:AMP-binding protein [Nocardioides sp. zg-1228]MBC2932080.1 AMP-binding protein [Nocardioides sp. zg-1228]QSF57628.1 AMP-binding protein [Nocardioides sp. zg-1228]
MGQIPVARAPALPGRATAPARWSPWRSLAHLATERPHDVAFVLTSGAGATRTWAEVAETVERAAAGLVRSGLRVDQVVVSLLPADHAHPELDLALRVVGAVVVHVAPGAPAGDLARELGDADVRLVVAEDSDDLSRLDGVTLPRAELFAVDGGRGWDRLLELGAERLVMDPTLVERSDDIVDPDDADPRMISERAPLGRVPVAGLRDGLVEARSSALVVADAADALLQVVRRTQLDLGFALCVVEDPARLPGVMAAVRPSVVVVPERHAGAVLDSLGDLGGAVEVVELADLRAADLPQPPPLVLGDAADLPRRSRRARGDDFDLRLPPEPGASAFLPALPTRT